MVKHIVYTKHDGTVAICTPTVEIFQIMRNGGYWDDRPPHYWTAQILRQIQSGIEPEHAYRFAYAVQYGGCDEAEVLDIIKDRDCARFGTNHTIIETEEIPEDRWFRNAWRQGSNSGQIVIDLEKARVVHWDKLDRAVTAENKERARAFEVREPIASPSRADVSRAADVDDLKRIWPDDLPRAM